MRALIIDRVSPLIKTRLKEYGVETDEAILLGREKLLEIIKNYDILIMRVDPAIDAAIMDASEGRLKMLAICSVGTNHVDLKHAAALGITVQNAPGLSNNAVAELTVSKMLDLCRHTMTANSQVKRDYGWNKYLYNGHELRGHTVGILGYGNIGSRVGKLTSAFGMRVLAYDPYLSAESCREKGAEKKELCEILREADILTIHFPLTDETKNMISEKEIAAMKPGSIIINMARGGVLDEQAAADALRSGHLAGVGIDAVRDELSVGGLDDDAKCNSPLIDMEGCIVSPHIGACTFEASDAIAEFMVGFIADRFRLNK